MRACGNCCSRVYASPKINAHEEARRLTPLINRREYQLRLERWDGRDGSQREKVAGKAANINYYLQSSSILLGERKIFDQGGKGGLKTQAARVPSRTQPCGSLSGYKDRGGASKVCASEEKWIMGDKNRNSYLDVPPMMHRTSQVVAVCS